MKRIVFFTGGDDLYGANKILYNTLDLFKNYERIVCVPNEGSLSKLIKETDSNVKIFVVPDIPVIAKKYLNIKGILYFIKHMWRVKTTLNSIVTPDSIVYLNTLAVLPVALFLKNYTVIHVHEILANNSFLNKVVNKIALHEADKIICVSDATARNLLNISTGEEVKKIMTVHNGIPMIDSPCGMSTPDNEKVKIALIGRIKPKIKGQNYVLDTLQFLSQDIKEKINISFIGSPVPGEEDDLHELELRIEKDNLSDIISIKGFTTDLAKIYHETDICLVPSIRADPFPTTVLEAMSAKLPVIGTNLGGIPEMIEDSITGFLIPPDDPKLFSDRLETLIKNKQLRLSMGEKGYEKFNREFSMDDYKKRYYRALPELFYPIVL